MLTPGSVSAAKFALGSSRHYLDKLVLNCVKFTCLSSRCVQSRSISAWDSMYRDGGLQITVTCISFYFQKVCSNKHAQY